jgi:hypothetical protein
MRQDFPRLASRAGAGPPMSQQDSGACRIYRNCGHQSESVTRSRLPDRLECRLPVYLFSIFLHSIKSSISSTSRSTVGSDRI